MYTMPPKKRTKRKRKKASYSIAPSRLVKGGFPKTKLVRLRYCEEVLINATAGAVQSHSFAANGMYDPNITGTGHQPMNYDTWMGLYDHYVVLSSKIKATHVWSSSGDAPSPTAYLAIGLTDVAGQLAAMAPMELLENRTVKKAKYLIPPSISAAPNGSVSVGMSFNASKFFGVSKSAVTANDKLQGSTTTNPTDLANFEIACAAVGGNDPAAFRFLVEIEYVALLSEALPGVAS